jgi:probable phosphoglycerate mutase
MLSVVLVIKNEEIPMESTFTGCKTTRVIIVRHGQSTYNTLGLYQGSSDESVLTELGHRDARQTGNFLKGVKFDAIYSSPLKRAKHTTEEILTAIAHQIESSKLKITSRLRETDLPNWHGLSFQYVRENFPEEYHTWKNRPHEFWMQIGNIPPFYPALNLYKRVRQFWQEILPQHIGQTLLIVAHGGTNKALISTALHIKCDRYHCIQQSNCGISVLDFTDGSLDSALLSTMNFTSHTGKNCLPEVPDNSEGMRLLLVPSATIDLERMEKLTYSLRNTTIDFSVNEHVRNAQVIAEQILQYHRQTVQLEVLRQDFSQVWQEAMETRGLMAKAASAVATPSRGTSQGGVASHYPTHKSLITGLVVADEEVIKSLIAQVINMDTAAKNLYLQPGTISCIHYPASQLLPVLQAINVLG